MTVGESHLIKGDGSVDPFPCDGTLPDCAGEHDGSVVVEGLAAINMVAPLVCDVGTGECLALPCCSTATNDSGGLGCPNPFDYRPPAHPEWAPRCACRPDTFAGPEVHGRDACCNTCYACEQSC